MKNKEKVACEEQTENFKKKKTEVYHKNLENWRQQVSEEKKLERKAIKADFASCFFIFSLSVVNLLLFSRTYRALFLCHQAQEGSQANKFH